MRQHSQKLAAKKLCLRSTMIDQRPSIPLSHPAAPGSARWRLRIACHRQGVAFRARLGGDAELAFDAAALTFRAFDCFIGARNQRFEFMVAAATCVIIKRHMLCSSMLEMLQEDGATASAYVRRRLYISLARSRIFRSLSFKLSCPCSATFCRMASSLASSCSSPSRRDVAVLATGSSS